MRNLLAAVLVFGISGTAIAATETMRVSASCTPGEKWTFTREVAPDARTEFLGLLRGTSSVARGISEALAYRREARTPASRAFGDYWLSRALYQGGLHHAAFPAFASVLARKAEDDATGATQRASVQCMTALVLRNPGFSFPEGTRGKLAELLADSTRTSEKREIWKAATLLLKQQVQEGRAKEELQPTVALLRGAGVYEAFSLGLWSAVTRDDRGAAAEMERFISLQSQAATREPSLDRHLDHARLIAARAYYGMKKYDQAMRQLKLVSRSSNELPSALSELAWSALGSRSYGEAIGAAIGLQAGGLRRVFAPETPMVLAMAMNELCQYPEALRAVNQFRKDYEPAYRWLKSWSEQPNRDGQELNRAAVAFLSRRKGAVPDRVASEWVRSPVFLVSQLELNQLADEGKAIEKVGRSGAVELRRMSRHLRAQAHKLARRVHAEKAKGISPALRSDLSDLLVLARHYRNFRAAGPVWRIFAENRNEVATLIQKEALRRIAADLTKRSHRMLGLLEDIAENNRLIEIEIFDGASQDIIWQNAHPDYKGVVHKMNSEKKRAVAAKVWDWGHAPIGSDAWSEVWEDEVGSFQSNLSNNCSNKEKYLAIKKSMLVREKS